MGKLGVVCNVGPLVEPTSPNRPNQNGSARVPLNLFSHSDSKNQWQTSVSNGQSTAGWGGRIADRTADLNIVHLPAVTSVAGTPIFTSGNVERPLAIAPAPTALNAALQLNGFLDPIGKRRGSPLYLRCRISCSTIPIHTDPRCERVSLEAVAVEKIAARAGNPTIAHFRSNPRTTLGNQLEQIAKVISIRNVLGHEEADISSAPSGGFDTHTGQVTRQHFTTTGTQANLLAQLSGAMRAFYDATVALGVERR